MKNSLDLWAALVATAIFASPAHATLVSTSSDGYSGTVGQVFSKIKVTVGAQWLDIEEDAELSAQPACDGCGAGPWLVEGTFGLPSNTVVTGCLLWNDDTLLMGKLRGKASAVHTFDSLVPVQPVGYRYDPLLVEQVGDSTYHLRLYPIADGGVRRIRLRYLVPVTAMSGEVPILPALFHALSGTGPSGWTLDVRGTAPDLQVFHDGDWFPIAPPAHRALDDTTVVFPLSDSAGSDYRRMKSWLNGVDVDYLLWRIPATASFTPDHGSLDIAANRKRFGIDLQAAGTLYSKDSGIVRHLVVVAVGPVPSGGVHRSDLAELLQRDLDRPHLRDHRPAVFASGHALRFDGRKSPGRLRGQRRSVPLEPRHLQEGRLRRERDRHPRACDGKESIRRPPDGASPRAHRIRRAGRPIHRSPRPARTQGGAMECGLVVRQDIGGLEWPRKLRFVGARRTLRGRGPHDIQDPHGVGGASLTWVGKVGFISRPGCTAR